MKRTELSQALGYSADYINRIIKKLTGHTLVEYNQKIVLQIAADYLKTTNININEICEKLGYTNRSFFNKIFKDQYGVSPSKYRTMSRK
ncbi:helix-turn-helix transcriptional regulator [Mediterraneibacter gnavus]|mgnify:CR=1 FL=1|uniref:helix-turn-helix domain-containing protein n=1 Tax=Mediterraneibacter gnavus TaxID=33038 RepID=UPI00046769CE